MGGPGRVVLTSCNLPLETLQAQGKRPVSGGRTSVAAKAGPEGFALGQTDTAAAASPYSEAQADGGTGFHTGGGDQECTFSLWMRRFSEASLHSILGRPRHWTDAPTGGPTEAGASSSRLQGTSPLQSLSPTAPPPHLSLWLGKGGEAGAGEGGQP